MAGVSFPHGWPSAAAWRGPPISRWPARPASVRLYNYNEKGDLIDKDTVLEAKADEPLQLNVPAKGLLIAEIVL